MDTKARCILTIAATLAVVVQGRNDTACLRTNGRYTLCVRTRFINPPPRTKEKYSLKLRNAGYSSSSEGFEAESLGTSLPGHDERFKPFGSPNSNSSSGSDEIKLQNGTTLTHGILPILTGASKNISKTPLTGHPVNSTSNTTNPSGLLDTIIGSFGRRPFPSTSGESAADTDTNKPPARHDGDLDQHDFFEAPPLPANFGNEKKTKGGSSGHSGVDEGFVPSTDFDLPSARFPPFEFESFPPRGFGSRVGCPELGGKTFQAPKLTPKVIKGGKPVYVDSDHDKDTEYPLVQIPIPNEGFNCVLVSVDFEHVTRKDRKKGRNANLMVEFRKSYYGDEDCYGNFVDF